MALFKKKIFFFKKDLLFSFRYVRIICVDLWIVVSGKFLGGIKWLSVAYAVRVLFLDTMFPTPTVRQTELGSPTSARLRPL